MPTNVDPNSEAQRAIGCHQAGRLADAEWGYRRALKADPLNAAILHLLGVALHQLERNADAVETLQKAVRLAPAKAEYGNSLGAVLARMGRPEEAIPILEAAIQSKPGYPDAHNSLGLVFEQMQKLEEAAECFRQAIAAKTDYPEAHNHLGNVLRKLDRADEAIGSHRMALSLRPGFAEARAGLAMDLGDLGRAGEAVACLRQVVEMSPNSASAHSDLLMTMQYDPRISREDLFEEARRWGERHGRPARSFKLHEVDTRPGRRLRVGYVSPDLREHPIGRLIEPVLAGHDREAFEVFCYSDAQQPDALTERLKAKAEVWRDIHGKSNEVVAQQIQSDRIDILVETAGHFGGNRLPLMAMRPAPVQVSHFGYCATSGVPAIDYRISDAWSDPPGQTERYHTERLVRLPDCAWCYCPVDPTPDVGLLPALAGGRVTFGNLNNLIKMSDAAVELWSRIVHATPGSRLMLLARKGACAGVRERFALHNIGGKQLTLIAPQPRGKYFELFHQIDVSLDPFPFNGDNSTCDALWMGVPVVSLAGNAFVSRRGVSHLSNVGLAELIGSSIEGYARIAIRLAADLPRLAGIRAGLRERLRQSPLGDAKLAVDRLEAVYRQIWNGALESCRQASGSMSFRTERC